MNITFDEAASPKVWLLEGTLEVKDSRYTFWYEYDERDGEVSYEFTDLDTNDNGNPDEADKLFDYDAFESNCQSALQKSWPIVTQLNTIELEGVEA